MRRSKRAEAIPEPSTIKGVWNLPRNTSCVLPTIARFAARLPDAAGFVYIPTVRPIRSPIRESAETCTSNDSGHKIHGMVILRHDAKQSQHWGQCRNLGLSSSSCNRPTLANQLASPLKHNLAIGIPLNTFALFRVRNGHSTCRLLGLRMRKDACSAAQPQCVNHLISLVRDVSRFNMFGHLLWFL